LSASQKDARFGRPEEKGNRQFCEFSVFWVYAASMAMPIHANVIAVTANRYVIAIALQHWRQCGANTKESRSKDTFEKFVATTRAFETAALNATSC
jgi:hypothetical protein